MQFDWTTFLLEVLNFLVLLWLLKRFLYRPVLEVLDARQARVRDERLRATQMLAEAQALQQQYDDRLAEWGREKQHARQQLEQELAQARAAGLEALRQSLADERQKVQARADSALAAREAALARAASDDAYRAAAAMLRRLASPALTEAIAALFREDLAALPEEERDVLRKAAAALVATSAVEIASAHPLPQQERAALAAALSQVAGRSLHIAFVEQPELLAGVRAVVGECQLHANLADELAFFRHGHAG